MPLAAVLRATLAFLSTIAIANASTNEGTYTSSTTQYNNQNSGKWPTTGDWLELVRTLSSSSKLYGPFKPSDYDEQCGPDGIDDYTNSFEIAVGGQGICMQYPSCINEFCLENNVGDDLPAYVIKARYESDVSFGIKFANKFNIQVTVKSSGHSISGASTAKDSLTIWLAHYEKDNTITTGFIDSCGVNSTDTVHDVIGISAGTNFQSIAEAVGDDYHFVSAGEGSVSAAGGWVQGGGLSYTSRKYGLGVDNAIAFRAVLSSGIVVVADRCTNTDLFWALKGGGGGTFGVVTHMQYKLHPKTRIIHFTYDLGPFTKNSTAIESFLKFWVEISQNLDKRWGGSFSSDGLDLYFAGQLVGAKMTFLDDFEKWIGQESDMFNDGYVPNLGEYTREYASWSEALEARSNKENRDYITDSSFSRLVPTETASKNTIQVYELLQSLALSDNLSKANYLLGGAINEVDDDESSVNPILRESSFLFTTNQYGYEKMLEMLPNGVSGVDKNHHGALEPDWRQSIWGDHYDRLTTIKTLMDPTKLFNCYQSVGYDGPEVNVFNTNTLTPAPTPLDTGVLEDGISSASSLGSKLGFSLFASACSIVLSW